MTNETRTIESGDLVDFTFKIQQAILDGYRLSDQGDFAPQNIGWVFVTTMEKSDAAIIGTLSMAVHVDTEQAMADIQKLAEESKQYVPELVSEETAEKIIAGAITVEPIVAEGDNTTKTTQRRGRNTR